MGFLDDIIRAVKRNGATEPGRLTRGVIAHGRQKNTGGHDHRSNTGDDRTPNQKKADKAKKK